MFTAARIAAIVGSTLAWGGGTLEAPVSRAVLPEPVMAEQAVSAPPAFVLGAGDALGVQIRANDVILAGRRGIDGARHAGVSSDR